MIIILIIIHLIILLNLSPVYTNLIIVNILNNATIVLNNADVNDSIDAKFLSDVELYQKFNNSTDNIIYTFSFSYILIN